MTREAELVDFILRLAHRIFLAHEVIGRWAEKDKPGRKKANFSHPCGFTLLELLVVVSILAVLATLTTAALVPARLTAQRNAVRIDFVRISQQVNAYKERTGKWPATLSQVTDQYRDPWGTPYLYISRATDTKTADGKSTEWTRSEWRHQVCLLISAGPDKVFAVRRPQDRRERGAGDDLLNWRE